MAGSPLSYARWEKDQHGKCYPGHHLPYRVRKPYGHELRCKVCFEVEIVLFEERKAA